MSVTDEAPVTSSPEPGDEDRLARLEESVERYRISRDGWTLVIFGLAALALVAAIVAIGVAATRDGGGGEATAVGATPLDADLSEFEINLSSASVETPGVISMTNSGTQIHNIAIEGTDLLSDDIDPGGTGTLDISSLEPGSYVVICTIAGHEDSGMRTELTVGTEGASGTPAGSDHHDLTLEEGQALDQIMVDSIAAFPAETEGVGNQPLEPEILADGTKHFEITAAITDWEVSPGNVVQAWTYNGMVPGPRIDLDVGDKVEVLVHNNLPLGTDVHWHGIDVPNEMDGVAGLTQEMIGSGETFTYTFTAMEPAIGMYHAHSHGQDAVPNGMFAAIYIGDVPLPLGRTFGNGLMQVPEQVDLVADLPMVVNDAGVIGLSLNGKSFPATAPLAVKLNDWFRVTYFNEGLLVHPMHLHGFPQLVVAKDGMALEEPYLADTINVAPGERYTVLVKADLPGAWVWHCHILNHAESAEGLFGMVTAVIVEE